MIPDAITLSTHRVAAIEAAGPASLAQVMDEAEVGIKAERKARLRPLATGFDPLDDVLNGGARPGELIILGGSYGVGKTIWGLQVAHHVVSSNDMEHALDAAHFRITPTGRFVRERLIDEKVVLD